MAWGTVLPDERSDVGVERGGRGPGLATASALDEHDREESQRVSRSREAGHELMPAATHSVQNPVLVMENPATRPEL